MNQKIKLFVASCLQGLFFFSFPDSYSFFPLLFLFFHCWLLVELFPMLKHYQQFYWLLLPSFLIRYSWVFNALVKNNLSSFLVSIIWYFFLIGLIVLLLSVVYWLIFKLFSKIGLLTHIYSKLTVYIIGYFCCRYLLDLLLVPGGEWVENKWLSILFSNSFNLFGSHLVDSWIYFLLLFSCCLLRGVKAPVFFRLDFLIILIILVVSSISGNRQRTDSKPIHFAIVKESFEKPSELLQFFTKKIKAKPKIDLWITTETAVKFQLEQKNTLYRLQQLLNKDQAIFIGAVSKGITANKFDYFNSVYFLKGGKFDYQIYNKNYLVPFAETIPFLFRFILSEPIIDAQHLFTEGNFSLLTWNEQKIAVGICFEEYFDSWYFLKPKKETIAFYVFLNNERIFNFWGKQFLKNIAIVKSRQISAISIRSTFEGYSGKLNDSTNKNNFNDLLIGKFYTNTETSFFLKLAPINYFVNLVFFILLLVADKFIKFKNKPL